ADTAGPSAARAYLSARPSRPRAFLVSTGVARGNRGRGEVPAGARGAHRQGRGQARAGRKPVSRVRGPRRQLLRVLRGNGAGHARAAPHPARMAQRYTCFRSVGIQAVRRAASGLGAGKDRLTVLRSRAYGARRRARPVVTITINSGDFHATIAEAAYSLAH